MSGIIKILVEPSYNINFSKLEIDMIKLYAQYLNIDDSMLVDSYCKISISLNDDKLYLYNYKDNYLIQLVLTDHTEDIYVVNMSDIYDAMKYFLILRKIDLSTV